MAVRSIKHSFVAAETKVTSHDPVADELRRAAERLRQVSLQSTSSLLAIERRIDRGWGVVAAALGAASLIASLFQGLKRGPRLIRLRLKGSRRHLRRRYAALMRQAKATQARRPARAQRVAPRQRIVNIQRLTPSSYRILEPRMVFDGAVAATVADMSRPQAEATHDAASSDGAHATTEPTATDVLAALASAPAAPAAMVREIAFVDAGVADAQALLAAMPSSIEVVMLDPTKDGVEQMANVLADRTGISAIHIVSSGGETSLHLGTADLSATSMGTTYAADMAAIKSALTANGDIFVYGNTFGSGTEGAAAAAQLAELTGAYVAPSTDRAGTASALVSHDALVRDAVAPAGDPLTDPLLQTAITTHNAAAAGATELAFVESDVGNVAELLKAVPENARIVLLDASQDGMDQIAQTLEGMSGVTAIHILSHGTEGNLSLGTADLNLQSMQTTYAADLAAIKGALAPDADILVYGCDFAKGTDGVAVASELSRLTGADVAASTDQTGAARFGGNWVLESRTGGIETTAIDGAGYDHLLAPPVDGNETATVTEDTTLTVPAATGLLANSSDPDGDPRVIASFDIGGTVTAVPAGGSASYTIAGVGTLTVGSDGSYSFAPATNYHGAVPVITYTVSDGHGGTDTSTLTLTMASVNDAPTGSSIAVTTKEDVPYTFTAADFGFADTDGNSLLAVKTTALPSNGTLSNRGLPLVAGRYVPVADIVAGKLVFTPAANASGAPYSSFTFQVEDNGGTQVTLDNGYESFEGYSGTPVAGYDNFSTYYRPGSSSTIQVAGTVGTFYGNPPVIFGTTHLSPVTGNAYTGLHSSGTYHQEVVEVTLASPIASGSASAISLMAYQVNIPAVPVFHNPGYLDIYGIVQGTNPTLNNATLTSSAAAATLPGVKLLGSTPLISNTAAWANYIVSFTASNTFDRLLLVPRGPDAFLGVDDLRIGLQSSGVDTDPTPKTVTVNVTPLNDAPAGTDNRITINPGDQRVMSVADFGFSDPNDSPQNAFRSILITTVPASGSLTYNNAPVHTGDVITVADIQSGALKFTSGNADTTFGFQVQDDGGTANGGVDTDPTANTITFDTPVNHEPLGADKTIDAAAGAAYAFTPADFGFSDPNDSPANALASVIITAVPTSGALTLNGNPVNDGDVVAVSDILSGALTFTPDWWASGNAYASFTFQVADNGGIAFGGVDTDQTPNVITIDIPQPNNAPDGADTYNMPVTTGVPVTIHAADFGFTDQDGDSLKGVYIYDTPYNGSLTLNGAYVYYGQFIPVADINANKLVFTPGPTWGGVGSEQFTFAVQDTGGTDNGGSDTDPWPNTMQFRVMPINTPPDSWDQNVQTTTASTYTLYPWEFGFNDAEGNQLLAVKITTLPTLGSLTYNNTFVSPGQLIPVSDLYSGALQYSSSTAGNGSFTYQVQDDGGTANGGVDTDPTPNTFTFNVAAINMPPDGTDATINVVGQYTLHASDLGFHDADGNAFLAVRIQNLSEGALTFYGSTVYPWQTFYASDLASGQLVYTPDPSGTGTANLTFQVIDDGGTNYGGNDTDPVANTLTFITGINSPPDGTDATISLREGTTRILRPSDFGFTDPDHNAFQAVEITTLPVDGTLTNNGVALTAGGFVLYTDLAAGQIRYTPPAGVTGTGVDSLTFQVQDDGGTVNGGVDTDPTPNTLTFDVTHINQPPTTTIAAVGPGTEDTVLSIPGIAVADSDTAVLTTELRSTHGTLTLPSAAGVTITGSGTALITISGSGTDITAALAHLQFVPVADYNGPAAVTATTYETPSAPQQQLWLTDSSGRIIKVDMSPSAIPTSTNDVLVGNSGIVALDIAFSPDGQLYAVTNGADLYTINQTTGVATFIASVPGVAFANGMVFDANGMGYLSGSNTVYRFDPNDLSQAAQVVATGGFSSAGDLAWSNGKLYLAAWDSNGNGSNELWNIDLTTGGASKVGEMGSNNVFGIDNDPSGQIYATANNSIYTVNAATGAMTLVDTWDVGGASNGAAFRHDYLASVATTATFNVTPVGDTVDDTVSTLVNQAKTFNVLTGTNGASADNFEGTPTVTAVSTPAHGTAGFAADGTVTYTPALGYVGADSFTYTVTSPAGVTETGTVHVTVASPPLPTGTPAVDLSGQQAGSIIGFWSHNNPSFGTALDLSQDTTYIASATNETVGSGLTRAGASFTMSLAPASGTTLQGTSLAYAINNNQYLEYSFTTPATLPADATWTSIYQADRSFNATTYHVAVIASTDHFATSNVLVADQAMNVVNGTYVGTSINTTDLQLQPSTTYSLRAYYFNASASGAISYDDWGLLATSDPTKYVTSYAAGSTPVSIAAPAAAVEDGDSANIASATIVLTNAQAGDVLTPGGLPAGINASVDTSVAGQITVTLVGSDTKANYEAAIKAISFSNPNVLASTIDRNITVVVSDGAHASNTAVSTIHVTAGNHPPVDGDETVAVTEDTPVSGNLLANASDVDGDTLTVSGFTIAGEAGPFVLGTPYTIAGQGTLTVNANGTYSFAPAADYNGGVPVVTYTVRDGHGGTDTSTLTLGPVTPVNDPPVDGDETVPVTEDTPVSGNLLTNASDGDGDPLTVSGFTIAGEAGPFVLGTAYTIAGKGTLTVNANGGYSFSPAADFNGGVPVVSYTVSDGHGGTDTSTLTLSVTPVNDPPVDGDESVPVTEDTPVAGNLLANASDVDGDTLTVSGFTIAGEAGPFVLGTPYAIAGKGTLTVNANGGYSFAPAANYNGSIPVVTYTVSDGHGGTDTSTLTLGPVSPVNDPPLSADKTIATAENTAYTFQPSDFAFSDPKDSPANSLQSVVIDTLPTNGTLYDNGVAVTPGQRIAASDITSGELTFVPTTGVVGSSTFQFQVQDDGGTANGGIDTSVTPNTFTLAITNGAPIAIDDTLTTTENTPVVVDVLGNDATVAGNTLTVSAIDGTAIDTLHPVTLADGSGVVALNGDGTLTFTPTTGYVGTPTFQYTIGDGHGGSATATVNGIVSNVAPTANDDTGSVGEDGPVLVGNVVTNDTAALGNTITVTGASQGGTVITVGVPVTLAGGGSFTLNANGGYSFDPGTAYNGLKAGQTATETVSYTIADGNGGTATASLVITIVGANDAPVVANETIPVTENVPAHGNVLGNDHDPDGDPLIVTSFSIPGLGSHLLPGAPASIPGVGTLTLASNGDVTFTPLPGYTGPVPPVTYSVDDGHGGTATGVLTLGPITPVNQAPVAHDDGVSTTQSTPLTFDPRGNDTDVDGDTLRMTSINGVAIDASHPVTVNGGTVSLGTDGRLTFTPLATFAGSAIFTYVVDDGHGGSASASVTVNVEGAQSTPFVPVVTGKPIELPKPSNERPGWSNVQGAVLEAVNDAAPLGDSGQGIAVSGIVVETANRISTLDAIGHGVQTVSDVASPLETGRRQEIWHAATTSALGRPLSGEPEGLIGSSLRLDLGGGVSEGGMRSQIVIEALVRDRTLIVQLSSTAEAGKRVADYRVLSADGGPVPGWLDRANAGLFIGERPANVDRVGLRVIVVYSDGTSETKVIIIETMSGEIKTLAPDQRTELRLPFMEQLAARYTFADGALDDLARVLVRR